MVRSKTPRVAQGSESIAGKTRGTRAVFIIAALDMSWRMALVVLIPIVGGFELDKHLGSGPALTIIGFLIAMAGVYLIMKRTVMNANEQFKPKGNNR